MIKSLTFSPNYHATVYLKCRLPTLKLALHCYLHGYNVTVATDLTAVQDLLISLTKRPSMQSGGVKSVARMALSTFIALIKNA